MFKTLLPFSLLAFVSVVFVSGEGIEIPVTPGPSPTCLGRLYSDILEPTGWGTDSGTATRFAQSPEGTLGITNFFEIGPYGDPASYSYNGSQAMLGVGAVSINRWRNDDRVQNVNNHGEQYKGGGIIAVIKESDAWHHETYRGEGTLLEGQRNRFYNVLNGSPQTLDCGGLINAWFMAQNVIKVYYGSNYLVARPTSVNPTSAVRALYYGSSATIQGVTLPEVSTANLQYVQLVGLWEVPKFPSGNYIENFWLLTNAVTRAGYGPFI